MAESNPMATRRSLLDGWRLLRGARRRWTLPGLVIWGLAGAWLAPGEARAAGDDLLPPGIVHEPCEFYKKGK